MHIHAYINSLPWEDCYVTAFHLEFMARYNLDVFKLKLYKINIVIVIILNVNLCDFVC